MNVPQVKRHPSRTWQAAATLLLAALFLFAGPATVQADVAPPEQPGGSSVSPGQEGTQVRMASEVVEIAVSDVMVDFTVDDYTGYAAQAAVTATFTMHNDGQASEEMLVRFPLNDPRGRGDGFFRYPKIENFTVRANGRTLDWITVETENPDPEDPPIQWAGFTVAFPPGEDVIIETHYTIRSTGYTPEARFTYFLETGAGWKGPIGEGDIILRLPYPATPENVLVGDEFSARPGEEFDRYEVRWHFEDLEPTQSDNWNATILAPDFWWTLLTQRETAADNPDDPDAMKALGDLYLQAAEAKGYFSLRPGAEHFVVQAEEVYFKALQMDPMDPATNEAYLEALAAHYFSANQLPEVVAPSADELVNQVNVVQALSPDSQFAADLIEEMSYRDENAPTPGGTPTFVPAIPTATWTPTPAEPTVTETPGPSPTPGPTDLAAEETPTPAPEPAQLPRWAIASACLLALVFLGGVLVTGVILVLVLRRR